MIMGFFDGILCNVMYIVHTYVDMCGFVPVFLGVEGVLLWVCFIVYCYCYC